MPGLSRCCRRYGVQISSIGIVLYSIHVETLGQCRSPSGTYDEAQSSWQNDQEATVPSRFTRANATTLAIINKRALLTPTGGPAETKSTYNIYGKSANALISIQNDRGTNKTLARGIPDKIRTLLSSPTFKTRCMQLGNYPWFGYRSSFRLAGTSE